MACGSCGGRKNVDYEITFKHDGSKRVVTQEEGGLAQARMLLEQAPKRGTIKAVRRSQ